MKAPGDTTFKDNSGASGSPCQWMERAAGIWAQVVSTSDLGRPEQVTASGGVREGQIQIPLPTFTLLLAQGT